MDCCICIVSHHGSNLFHHSGGKAMQSLVDALSCVTVPGLIELK